jgi:hypothetical protein
MRDSINRRPGLTLVLAAVLVIGGGFAAGWQWMKGAGAGSGRATYASRSWYTSDDGRSAFVDEAGKLVPFERDGKTIYRCYLWTCDGGKTRFVAHLERIKPDVLAALKSAGRTRADLLETPPGSIQVKRPQTGDTGWCDIADPRAEQITTPPPCPAESGAKGSSSHRPQPVLP